MCWGMPGGQILVSRAMRSSVIMIGLRKITMVSDAVVVFTLTLNCCVDVLPRHYLTTWEALGHMTAPDITRNEWSIG